MVCVNVISQVLASCSDMATQLAPEGIQWIARSDELIEIFRGRDACFIAEPGDGLSSLFYDDGAPHHEDVFRIKPSAIHYCDPFNLLGPDKLKIGFSRKPGFRDIPLYGYPEDMLTFLQRQISGNYVIFNLDDSIIPDTLVNRAYIKESVEMICRNMDKGEVLLCANSAPVVRAARDIFDIRLYDKDALTYYEPGFVVFMR